MAKRFQKANQGNKTGKTYPERSKRQELHGFRRAQGGPGITEGKDPVPRQTVSEAGIAAWLA